MEEYLAIWEKSMMMRVIQNAFKRCGIHPFDDTLFTDTDFGLSLVTSMDCSHMLSSYPERIPTSSESVEMTDSQASSGSGGDGECNEDSTRGKNDEEDQDGEVRNDPDRDDQDGDDEDGDDEDGDNKGGDNQDRDNEDRDDEDTDTDDEDMDEVGMVGQQGDMGAPDKASDDNDPDYVLIVKDKPVSDMHFM